MDRARPSEPGDHNNNNGLSLSLSLTHTDTHSVSSPCFVFPQCTHTWLSSPQGEPVEAEGPAPQGRACLYFNFIFLHPSPYSAAFEQGTDWLNHADLTTGRRIQKVFLFWCQCPVGLEPGAVVRIALSFHLRMCFCRDAMLFVPQLPHLRFCFYFWVSVFFLFLSALCTFVFFAPPPSLQEAVALALCKVWTVPEEKTDQ